MQEKSPITAMADQSWFPHPLVAVFETKTVLTFELGARLSPFMKTLVRAIRMILIRIVTELPVRRYVDLSLPFCAFFDR